MQGPGPLAGRRWVARPCAASTTPGVRRWGPVTAAAVDVTAPEFATRFGAFLRRARETRGLGLRHLRDADLRVRALRAIERGTHPLEPLLVAELAARYGVDLDELLPPRQPLVFLATGTIASGGMDEPFTPGDVGSILEAYLRLIRRLRGGDAAEAITLRRDDVVDIADHLGRPRTEIVDRLAELMGASTSQRRAMVDLYLSGALVVGIAS